MPARRLLVTTCAASALAAAPAAGGAPAEDDLHPRDRRGALGPSPEQPAFGLMYRDGTRGQLGAPLPLAGARGSSRLALVLPALVELHNAAPSESEMPNESWRGRMGLELWGTLLAQGLRRTELGLALEHESDHSTARWGSRLDDFYSLNDIALKGAHWFGLGLGDVGVETGAKLYVLSCSRPAICSGLRGSTASGGELSLVVDLSPSLRLAAFAPFLGFHVSAIGAHGDVRGEARAVAHAGVWLEGARHSQWSFFALAFFGNDVGITRGERVKQLGAGLRWAP